MTCRGIMNYLRVKTTEYSATFIIYTILSVFIGENIDLSEACGGVLQAGYPLLVKSSRPREECVHVCLYASLFTIHVL